MPPEERQVHRLDDPPREMWEGRNHAQVSVDAFIQKVSEDLPDDHPNYADADFTLPAGHWRALRDVLKLVRGGSLEELRAAWSGFVDAQIDRERCGRKSGGDDWHEAENVAGTRMDNAVDAIFKPESPVAMSEIST